MTLLRMLNPQGMAGLAASLCLAVLLILQKGEARHWRKQSGQFEQLYQQEQSAFAQTVADYRAAAAQTDAADKANAGRIRVEQASISERTSNDYQTRLAGVRAHAERLRIEAATSAADSGVRAAAPMPGLSAASGGAVEDPGQDRLSAQDALTATEQAIQLDELIKWVREQAKVDPNSDPRSR